MLVSTSEDFNWYILFVFVCLVIYWITSKREILKEGFRTGCVGALLISSIGGLLISIFAILLTSTYYEVSGDGNVKKYHIVYYLDAPNGERIWTYGSKMYCYNKSNEEFKIRSLQYGGSYNSFGDKVEKIVKPHEFFKVPENIDVLYFWKVPKTVREKVGFSKYRCLFMRKGKNSIDIE